jgi:hypothetical protein
MSGGTGEFESSDEEGGVRVPIVLERLATVASTNAQHPPNYPVQSLIVSTATVTITIQVAGSNTTLTNENILAIARELINSARQ